MTNYAKLELSVFCANIRILRKQHNLTQKEMAAIMGVGVYSVKKLEAGIVPPMLSCDALFRLCRYFHKRPNLFFIPMEP